MKSKTLSSSAIKVDKNWRIAIVKSVWHPELTDVLASDAVSALKAMGVHPKNILVIDAPGSFEVPLLVQTAIEEKKVNGVIAFGVVVEGQTYHAELIAKESARALMDLSLALGTPVTFEILYVRKYRHAKARSIGKNGKGKLAAQTLLNTLAAQRKLS